MQNSTPPPAWDSLTEQQRIEWIAVKVMGWYEEHSHYVPKVWNWEKCGKPVCCSRDERSIGEGRMDDSWDPLTDWNHWRQVEEKVMEDKQLWENYMFQFLSPMAEDTFFESMASDLPTRCRALYLAYSSPHAH